MLQPADETSAVNGTRPQLDRGAITFWAKRNIRFRPTADIRRLWNFARMNAKLSDWLKLGAALLVVAALSEIIALMMNFGGDCGPGVERCGETARQLSFVVLGVGLALALFLVVRFVRVHRR